MAPRTIDLTVSLRPYDLVRPVREVGIAGTTWRIDFRDDVPSLDEFLAGDADVAELDLGEYVSHRVAGGREAVALPVFPSRRFVHRSLSLTDAVTDAADLAGRRVGVADGAGTTAAYVRALLAEGYAVAPERLEWAPADDERLDALVAVPPHPSETAAGLPLRPAFATPGPTERADVERSGVFPIHHVVVMRPSLLTEERWLAANVFRAFEVARRRYLYRLGDIKASRLPIPSVAGHARRLREWLGDEIWPYGVAENRVTIQAFLDHAEDAGGVGVDDLFHPVEPYVDGM